MYSFDVFDTLITRRTVSPTGIFSIMETKLRALGTEISIPKRLLDDFYQLRIGAEQLARISARNENRAEIVLRDIYVALASIVYLGDDLIDWLCELEIRIELDNVIAVPVNVELYKRVKREGNRVVLISDMYLPHETIRQMLVSIDPVFSNSIIYVSSEYLKTKSNGQLFLEVKNREKVEYKDWIHIGDNSMTDVKIPQEYGIETMKVNHPKLLSYERIDHTSYKQL